MRTLLEDFLASEKMLRDPEVMDLLGWSSDTLIQKRARKEAPPSIKIRAIHLTRYSDLAEFISTNGRVVNGGGKKISDKSVADDLLGRKAS